MLNVSTRNPVWFWHLGGLSFRWWSYRFVHPQDRTGWGYTCVDTHTKYVIIWSLKLACDLFPFSFNPTSFFPFCPHYWESKLWSLSWFCIRELGKRNAILLWLISNGRRLGMAKYFFPVFLLQIATAFQAGRPLMRSLLLGWRFASLLPPIFSWTDTCMLDTNMAQCNGRLGLEKCVV